MAITTIVLNGSLADLKSTGGEVGRNNDGEARMGGRRKC